MTNEKKAEYLWKVKIGEKDNEHELYVISEREPALIEETVGRKLRRLVGFTFATDYIPSNPMFTVPRGQYGHVEQARDMYGFPLQELTEEHIVLGVENSEHRKLYEVALFSRKVLTSFQKTYVLARNKREAVEMLAERKQDYKIKAQQAKKMNCYSIVRITDTEIVLDRSITKSLSRWQKMALLSEPPRPQH